MNEDITKTPKIKNPLIADSMILTQSFIMTFLA
jgi:hypothetical protein